MLLNATLNQEKAPIHTKSDTEYRPSLKQSRREPRYSIILARLRTLPQPAPSFPTPILVRMRADKRHNKNNENKTRSGKTQGYRTRYQTRDDGDSQLKPHNIEQ